MEKYKDFLGLGIAGNFALHLAQAGELEDFKEIITADEAAPKGMFPFYLPKRVEIAKEILNTYPLSSSKIKLPNQHLNVQAEPEVGLICTLEYTNNKLSKITPTHFGAYNDCSIRVAGASKISDKKNWGENSKGLSENLIAIDKFSECGIMDNYSICSFLKRDDEFHAYGEDVELIGYSYFYEKLLEWIIEQINTQKDFGPLEPLSEYISICQNPTKAIISIGATRYTHYGETTFLKNGDEVFIILYNNTLFSPKSILESIKNNNCDLSNMSILRQKVFS
ncbi:MAG: hypothetical protein A3E21_05845 [Sulfurimonas sp. RIFCSPHIGHO2_12_FULL_36_9]|uniref:DUF5718 family protein n=1 Tax=Sulfurimonas sp. RIFCSPLOWO2_12_36_12 TaxID=1802253 RepID=UPI0008BE69A0|nr:DUF5718 family protein [Sulfurimonas sp. RIFCSPLOWO2_12_36_12]OHD97319.1 MAG: hypothetical protein A3E21_05845 [Sulfurimonas sp. RIFCSPHIGHO2_12_FULL_36_9]OHD97545.1 MAG: hypothetical protein A3J26_05665 [Sulfurimonas sp. RIFCSPLOWO2_02_FULL_36_28]OHE00466.1 MAG: hypothetical protein A2W82_04085 [Sulfurimonas sp. RIFCSPLOWO2_12_36_12]OHE08184.1 MAG: hypothetical protein A3K14_10245 [Sulfurimonas sp. RIFCSPLOWO2_12_FULL_36_74]